MSLDLSSNTSTASEIAVARQTDYVAFLHRVPFAADALALGFLPGFREDCGYQETQYQNLTLPVGMLDNDFRNPDLERFADRFFEHEPQVGVIGDVYKSADVDDHVAAAREIQGSYPEAELIVVPKCQAVIDEIPEDLVLGYSRGYADRLAHEFSDSADWRGRHVHILGGSPPQATLGARTVPSMQKSDDENVGALRSCLVSQLSVQTRLRLRHTLLAFILYADTLLSINQIAIVLDRAYNTIHRAIRDLESS